MIIEQLIIDAIALANEMKIELKFLFRMIDGGFLKINFPLIEFL
jgi:hypothetical protein